MLYYKSRERSGEKIKPGGKPEGVKHMYRVEQFKHANQFIIHAPGVVALQSYASEVARVDGVGGLSLGGDWDYSPTTRRHVYAFIEEVARISLPAQGRAAYIRKEIARGNIGTF